MATAIKKDNTVAIAACFGLFTLVVGFGLAALYFKNANKVRPDVAYATFAPVVIHSQDYSIAASFVLQTTPANAAWVEKNKKELDTILKSALNSVDPSSVLSPDGLQTLQTTLASTTNSVFKTEKVQQILFTDFVLQSN